MGRVALILGSSAYGSRGEEIASAAAKQGAIAWQRHGDGDYRLPHRIDHAANFRSLIDAGCDRAIGVSSVGSLKAELGIGSFVCPDDFIAPQANSSIYDDVRGHVVPGFDDGWRRRVLGAWQAAATTDLHDGGVYWQMTGPRFETPAEVRLIAAHADVVGMTVASECIAAVELGIPYAAVCVVDNLANGIGPGPLTVEEIEAVRDVNTALIRDALVALLLELVE